MSFAGFVFDMIRRDKENRDLRNLRRERLKNRLDKLYDSNGLPVSNITVEEIKEIQKQTAEKERSEQSYSVKMMLVIIGICIVLASILVLIFIK